MSNVLINAFYTVYNSLGYGFLEKVYENALILELKKRGIQGRRQVPLKVYYDDQQVGDYYADIIVENRIIVELKAAEVLREEHEAQLINYLRATSVEVGFLFNFGKEASFRRKIFENKYKKFVPLR